MKIRVPLIASNRKPGNRNIIMQIQLIVIVITPRLAPPFPITRYVLEPGIIHPLGVVIAPVGDAACACTDTCMSTGATGRVGTDG